MHITLVCIKLIHLFLLFAIFSIHILNQALADAVVEISIVLCKHQKSDRSKLAIADDLKEQLCNEFD